MFPKNQGFYLPKPMGIELNRRIDVKTIDNPDRLFTALQKNRTRLLKSLRIVVIALRIIA